MRPAAPEPLPDPPPPPFLRLPTRPRPHRLIGGWAWRRRRLRAEAVAAAGQGAAVTLLLLVPGTMPHRQRFHEGGWWEQSGGVAGPAAPGDTSWRRMTMAERVRRECARLDTTRSTAGDPMVAFSPERAER